MKLRVRRRPREIIVERWDGPGAFIIPAEQTKHSTPLIVEPGNYIADAGHGDRYPLAADMFERDFDIVGPAE